jgi:hypothetical protein
LACIPVAPAARPFFNPLTTLHTSESVGKSSGIAKEGKFYGRGGPKGGALTYSSTLSAVCFTIVSWHAGRGWSTANLYHPLRVRHASFMAPAPRWPSTSVAAFAAHCLRSTVREVLISRPN